MSDGPAIDVHAAAQEAASTRKAGREQIPQMAQALARAFYDDPVFSWVLRHDAKRMKVMQRAFSLFLRRVWIDDEQTYTTGQVIGAAVWEPPGQWQTGVGEQLRLLPAMVGCFGRHLPRVLQVLTRLESAHPDEPQFAPHYYLAFLGVEPDWQGRGLGSALLAPVLERCDSDRVPAFLEASTARNRVMYERHGFEVMEEFTLGKGAPPQWRMWREPAPEVSRPTP